MGIAAIYVMWPNLLIYFHSLLPFSFHMIFGSKWLYIFWEKQVLNLKSGWPLAKVR